MKVIWIFTVLLVFLLPLQGRAQEDASAIGEESLESLGDDNALQVNVKGFVDTYHAVRAEGRHDWMASKTRVRAEVKVEKGPASVYTSLNALYDGILKDDTGIELREAYLSWAKGGLDLRAGRQIVVWGVADGLRVTDCISPFDYTEFLAEDYDDIRIPVNLLRVRYSWNVVTLELVYCPVPEFFIIPTDEGNPWSVHLSDVSMPYEIDLESGKPQRRLCNTEFGGRIGANLRGIDFSVCALRTWNKMPALRMSLSEDQQTLLVRGEYQRMTMLGADCSMPLGQFVLRGETAFYFGEAQSAERLYCNGQCDVANFLVGVDWYPGDDWMLSTQYCHKYIVGSVDELSVFQNSGLATVRISKDLLQGLLKLSTFAYIDVTQGGIFNRFSASYSLNDQMEVTAGFDFFHADHGQFSSYRKNSEIWFKMKYSF